MAKKTNKIVEIELPYKFTEDELIKLGHDLAEMRNDYDALEEEKKATAAQYKAKMDDLKVKMDNVGKYIIDGEVQRMTKCEVRLNDPVVGKKTLYRQDTGEVAAIQQMDEKEMQTNIFDMQA